MSKLLRKNMLIYTVDIKEYSIGEVKFTSVLEEKGKFS